MRNQFVRAQWPRTNGSYSNPAPVIAAHREVPNRYERINPARVSRGKSGTARAKNQQFAATFWDQEGGR